ncbi:MAG: copper resistance CopC family protein, partial [Candidatus Limnocylindrales bacterium]
MSTNDSRRGAARHHRPVSPPLPRRAFAALSGLLLALAIVAPALAHVALVRSTPADKAVLDTSPTTITLTFSESLSASDSSFKLIGPTGTVGTGRVGGDDNVMTLSGLVLDGRPLGPGAYEIRWAAKGTDGHLERGKLTFTVTEPTPTPTPEPTAQPSA